MKGVLIFGILFLFLVGGVLAELILSDDFEYVVDRDTSGASAIFAASGPWDGAKTYQDGETGARGYLYTATSIPGFSGSFPGIDSNNVLVIEALPETFGSQTDFYLSYGDTENPADDNLIPGDVWFQFWLYINYYGDQLSQIDSRNKFIYPCNGPYGCQTGKWLFMIGSATYNPFRQSPYGVPSNGEAFLVERDNQVGDIAYELAEPWDQSKLGQQDISEHLVANRWTLVKLHFDTSTTSGSWEAWLKPLGGDWTKVVEWIDGVTPNFHWTLNPEDVGGHRGFKMPTTFPAPAASGHDAWIYMDDFAMADSEADLPVYGTPTYECSNSLDDDGDGQIDLADVGCTDANDDDESNCGDLVCEGGETCSSCVSDCPTGIGEVCCSSVIYTGDCCTNSDCTAPETCVSYQCQTSTSCGTADTDSSGDINIGEIINYITRYKNGEVDIGEVIAGITEYRYGC